MGALHTLLEVQDHDVAIERLAHQRATLPERAELAAVEERLRVLDAELVERRERAAELERDERRLADEAAGYTSRAREAERRLYSGEMQSPRDLQVLQSEVEHLRVLGREVEDRELAVMERREPLEAEISRLQTESVALTADAHRLRAQVTEHDASLEAELVAEKARRDRLVEGIPAGILATYERCRVKANGVGIARLDGYACQGCHLTIPAVDADAFRHRTDDELAFCENCGCILVAR